MRKVKYEIVEETHTYNDKVYKDLVCYFGSKRFVLIPLNKSVKAKSYFYALLNNCNTK